MSFMEMYVLIISLDFSSSVDNCPVIVFAAK